MKSARGFQSLAGARPRRATIVLAALQLLAIELDFGCNRRPELPRTALSAGPATVFDDTRDAFSLPTPGLSEAHRRTFFVGNSFFNQNWVSAPSSVANRDGLGPLFNARSCSTCHFKDGRSRPPDSGGAMSTMLLRVSVRAARNADGSPVADAMYGDQIQGAALPGVPPEADVIVEYDEIGGSFADGERYTLRRPRYRLEHLGYGPPALGLSMSPRVAPALVGLGLLEAVAESTLARLADPDDRDADGISGRPNRVWDVAGRRKAVGRFGWKAEQPSVLQQTAGAFHGDMGLSSSLFPTQSHTGKQESCRGVPDGGSPEVEEQVLSAIALYARVLAVPARRSLDDPRALRGEELFLELGCASCHVATLRAEPTAELSALGSIEIHPYTDLLLHDMGNELSDHRPSFDANGNEWRTPPLWGLGLVHKVNDHTTLLHDGRARNATEAILWHGGEGESAKRAFASSKRSDRQALIAFLNSL